MSNTHIDDEYVWDIALSTRLDPDTWGEVAFGTREAVILNIYNATGPEVGDSDLVPVGDVANIIMNLWQHMRDKTFAERHATAAAAARKGKQQ